jgi:hypothetical protein
MIPTASRVAGAPAPAQPPLSASALLAAWQLRPAPAHSPITQTLAQALGWADALALSQVLDQTWPPGVPPAPACQAVLQEARAALERLQQELADAMRDPLLAADAAATAVIRPALAPYRLHLSQQQRHLAARVASLRERLQQRLVSLGGPLAPLAQLDALLARALAEPERQAFAALAAQLWQRAERHLDADPRHGLRRVWQDLQRLLEAELAQRLQPVCGLIEALEAHAADPQPPA